MSMSVGPCRTSPETYNPLTSSVATRVWVQL